MREENNDEMRRAADNKAGILINVGLICSSQLPTFPIPLKGDKGRIAFSQGGKFHPELLFCALAGIASEAHGMLLDSTDSSEWFDEDDRGSGFKDIEACVPEIIKVIHAIAEDSGKSVIDTINSHWPDVDWRRGVKGAAHLATAFWGSTSALSDELLKQGRVTKGAFNKIRAGKV